MCFLVIEQLPGTHKARCTRRPASSEFAFAIVSTTRLNFSMTNPNAIAAMPVRTPSEKGSLVGSMITVAADHEYLIGRPNTRR